jgi:hypothetical protein
MVHGVAQRWQRLCRVGGCHRVLCRACPRRIAEQFEAQPSTQRPMTRFENGRQA